MGTSVGGSKLTPDEVLGRRGRQTWPHLWTASCRGRHSSALDSSLRKPVVAESPRAAEAAIEVAVPVNFKCTSYAY